MPYQRSVGRPAQQPFRKQPTRVMIMPTRIVNDAASQNPPTGTPSSASSGTESGTARIRPPYMAAPPSDDRNIRCGCPR